MQMPKTRTRRQRIGAVRIYFFTLALILTAALVALLAQTAFARTYVITDGDRTVTYTSFATDPARILGQAGVALNEHDTYTTQGGLGRETITICRAQQITIRYHGQVMEVTSQGETAGELLSRLNLALTGEDVTSHGLDTPTYDGMELKVDRIVTRQERYTTTIPHEVTYRHDSSLPQGSRKTLQPGQDGEVLCTAGVTYVNGQEQQRTVLSQAVTRQPVKEVVALGTGAQDSPDRPVIRDGFIYLPSGEVLSYSGTATIRATAYTHTDPGCDMVTATGTTVHWGTVAVDPRYIPYGTRMFIVSNDGEVVYGVAVAEDCGGDIKGDRMDLYMPTFDECIQFGRRVCTIYYLD